MICNFLHDYMLLQFLFLFHNKIKSQKGIEYVWNVSVARFISIYMKGIGCILELIMQSNTDLVGSLQNLSKWIIFYFFIVVVEKSHECIVSQTSEW